jgi:hypothetical protein
MGLLYLPVNQVILLVPGMFVGSIIGRGGCEINRVQGISGAEIGTAKENEINSSDRRVSITGTVVQTHHAMLQLLGIVDECLTKPGNAAAVPGGASALKILVPNHAVRFIIGKQVCC